MRMPGLLPVCLMFKGIHGPAPHYLSNDVTMHVDIHGYNTRNAENMGFCIRVINYGISCPRGANNLRL